MAPLQAVLSPSWSHRPAPDQIRGRGWAQPPAAALARSPKRSPEQAAARAGAEEQPLALAQESAPPKPAEPCSVEAQQHAAHRAVDQAQKEHPSALVAAKRGYLPKAQEQRHLAPQPPPLAAALLQQGLAQQPLPPEPLPASGRRVRAGGAFRGSPYPRRPQGQARPLKGSSQLPPSAARAGSRLHIARSAGHPGQYRLPSGTARNSPRRPAAPGSGAAYSANRAQSPRPDPVASKHRQPPPLHQDHRLPPSQKCACARLAGLAG